MALCSLATTFLDSVGAVTPARAPRRSVTVAQRPCGGRLVRLIEAGEIMIKAKLMRGSDDMPELQLALAGKIVSGGSATLGVEGPHMLRHTRNAVNNPGLAARIASPIFRNAKEWVRPRIARTNSQSM